METFSAQFVAGAVANGCADERRTRDLGEHGQVRRLRLQQVALDRLRADHLPDRLPQGATTASSSSPRTCRARWADSDKIKDFLDDARALGDPRSLVPDVERSAVGVRARGRTGSASASARSRAPDSKAIEALDRGARAAARARAQPDAACAERGGSIPRGRPSVTWEALIKAGSFDCERHRPRRRARCTRCRAWPTGRARPDDRKAGQGTFFGAFGDGPASRATSAPHARDRSEQASRAPRRWRLEYEVLGFYLTGHPLQERAGLFSLLSTSTARAAGAAGRSARSRSRDWCSRSARRWSRPADGRQEDGALPARGPLGDVEVTVLPAHLRGVPRQASRTAAAPLPRQARRERERRARP